MIIKSFMVESNAFAMSLKRKHITASFHRFSASNSKFKILESPPQTQHTNHNNTYLDHMIMNLIKLNIDTHDIMLLTHFIKEEQYWNHLHRHNIPITTIRI
eukprot:267570_1